MSEEIDDEHGLRTRARIAADAIERGRKVRDCDIVGVLRQLAAREQDLTEERKFSLSDLQEVRAQRDAAIAERDEAVVDLADSEELYNRVQARLHRLLEALPFDPVPADGNVEGYAARVTKEVEALRARLAEIESDYGRTSRLAENRRIMLGKIHEIARGVPMDLPDEATTVDRVKRLVRICAQQRKSLANMEVEARSRIIDLKAALAEANEAAGRAPASDRVVTEEVTEVDPEVLEAAVRASCSWKWYRPEGREEPKKRKKPSRAYLLKRIEELQDRLGEIEIESENWVERLNTIERRLDAIMGGTEPERDEVQQ